MSGIGDAAMSGKSGLLSGCEDRLDIRSVAENICSRSRLDNLGIRSSIFGLISWLSIPSLSSTITPTSHLLRTYLGNSGYGYLTYLPTFSDHY